MSDILTTILKRDSSISTNISLTKNLEDLDMMDSFLFEGITENTDDAILIANIIIKRVCGYAVPKLIIETEKQLKGISLNNRGIRMDVLATEKEGEKTLRVYDIEPNKYKEHDLPRRSRYYQALIDTKLLSVNTDFKELPDSFSIWVLPYDPFGDDRMIYTIKNMVVENNHLVYNDGVTKFFLYTKGSKGGSKELKELLTFMEHTTQSNAVDEELQEIQKIVTRIKSQSDVKERYMTLQEVIDYEKRDSYEEGVDAGRELGLTEGMKLGRSEGIELGRSEGLELGRSEGISLGIIQGIISTCKLLNRNKSQTKAHLMRHFHLTEDKADEYIDLHW